MSQSRVRLRPVMAALVAESLCYVMLELVAGDERDRSAIDTQSAKSGTMNTPVARKAIASSSWSLLRGRRGGLGWGASDAGGNVETVWAARDLSWSGRFG